MNVIPVLDLMDGVVVLASGGQRDAYARVNTPLCRDPSATAVMRALLAVHAFGTFYIADLDSITKAGSNCAVVTQLARLFPRAEFWLDAGLTRVSDLDPYNGIDNIRFVVGSESLDSIEHYTKLREDPRLERHVLSLDRKDGVELGPHELIRRPELWPQTLISMDLNRVGENQGPNGDRLLRLAAARNDIDMVAAGGIRGIDDLQRLASDGIAHALVATALHQKNLGSDELIALAAAKKNAP